MTPEATKADFMAYRVEIREQLGHLFAVGLGKQIERHAKALEATPDNAELKARHDAKEAIMQKFANGEFSLEPDMQSFFGRDAEGNSGSFLGLLYFGVERFVRKHPASVALTGDEKEDAELRDLIMHDMKAIVAVHSQNLLGLVMHLEAGCSQCLWITDIVAKYKDLRKVRKELKEAHATVQRQASALSGSRRTIDEQQQEMHELQQALARFQQEIVAKDARIAELASSFEAVSQERARYRQEADRLRQKLDTNPAQTTLVQIAALLYRQKRYEEWAKEKRHDEIVSSVLFLLRFFQMEKGAVDLREKAEAELDEQRKRLVEDDRVQLRDEGHPKFANRLDLVKALQSARAKLLEDLLNYRRDWDKKLAGHTVNQKTYEKLFEGWGRWKANSTITSLWKLSRMSGIDRKTLRKYHVLGIADLSRWIPEGVA